MCVSVWSSFLQCNFHSTCRRKSLVSRQCDVETKAMAVRFGLEKQAGGWRNKGRNGWMDETLHFWKLCNTRIHTLVNSSEWVETHTRTD